MKTLTLLCLLLLAGCATPTIERVIAACQGEVLAVDYEKSDYRERLQFECRE